MYKLFFFVMFFIMLYQLIFYVIAIFTSGVRLKEMKQKNKSRVLSLVFAHNEENCIRNLIRDLKSQTLYKSGYMDILVVCDNCNDLTEYICIENNVIVINRTSELKGKQNAMIDFYDKYVKVWEKYKSIVLFDADSRVKPDYVEKMSAQLYGKRKIVQSYIENCNNKNNILSRSYEINYKLMSGIINKTRELLGLNSYLGGTGYIVKTELLKKISFDCKTLVDDLEYTVKLVLNGERVNYTDTCAIYIENPIDIRKSTKQRLRWMRGQYQVFNKYALKYIVSLFKKFTLKKLDMLIMMLNPYVMISACINLVYVIANYRQMLPYLIWNVFYIGVYILIDYRSKISLMKYVVSTVFINIINYFVTLYALVTHKKMEWVRTDHNGI